MLGQALRQALGDKAGISNRYGTSFVPMDETLGMAVWTPIRSLLSGEADF